MLEPWLQLGDAALAFASPKYLPFALGAIVILALAVVTHLRRRNAYRDGSLASTDTARLWIATTLRTLSYLAVVAAISGATLVETEREDRLEVVALVDGSESIPATENAWIQAWLAELAGGMRQDDALSILRFGSAPVLEAGPGAPSREPQAAVDVERGGTNLMAAIESGANFATRSGGNGVVVLLTDGNETAGDASAAAESARRHGVRVHPIVPPRSQAPLGIEHIGAPKMVRSGQEIDMAVAITNRSQNTHEADLVVRHFDKELGRVPLRVGPGRSVVDAVVRAGPPGHYGISIDLEGAGNVTSLQGTRTASLTVLGPPRILLVSPSSALTPLLENAGFLVERRPDLRDVDAADLAPFHAVVLGDVASVDLPQAGQVALERYVRDLGGGLILAAASGLVADENLKDTPLARLLPVKIEKQEPRKRVRQPFALFLIIDRSSSMTYGLQLSELQPTRITYARDAALTLIDQLEDRDWVGAAAFDTETSLLSAVEPLSKNREQLTDMIARLVPSGGTDFKEALEIATRQLLAQSLRTKHIILLTDGASIRPKAEHDALIEGLAKSDVTVTSIRIGDDKDSYDLIRNIAEATGGHFYHVKDSTSLPDLMISDTRRRAGREDDGPKDVAFRPRIRTGDAEALGGLVTKDMPLLRTFAKVPLKDGAQEWIGADHGEKPAPILAGWQNGLGRVAVFTANPTREWQSWGGVRRFWSQLIRWAARPESAEELRLAVQNQRGRTVLEIDTFDREEGTSLLVRLFGRDGGTHELRPTPLRPRHYEVELPAVETIEPRVEIAIERNGEVVFTRDEWLPQASAAAQARREDPEAEANMALLKQIAEVTGGSVNAPIDKILKRAPADRQITFPLAYWLALGAFGLALIDIGVRHTRFE
ncbi:MAG: VWA domain-containing protein [Candidatus Binatia bacterium]|nr:VWA domain-containing protein [Candidatus Binatia bacterium]